MRRRGPTLDDVGPDGEAHWRADGCAPRNAAAAGLRSHDLPRPACIQLSVPVALDP
jgi:hypothetical protein